MEEFRNALSLGGLSDLGWRGNKFTWSNGHADGSFVKERLDRAVANQVWRKTFNKVEVESVIAWCSNHLPILLSYSRESSINDRNKRLFRYEMCWDKERECSETVKEAWGRNEGERSRLSNVQRGLNLCRQALRRDVDDAVLEFLNGGNMVPDLNHTLIALIPKVKMPKEVMEYRPISLCNVLYKLISKVLTNRVKKYKKDDGIHWWKWSRLGQGKSYGGLGFRQLEDFNLAMLAKQGWRILKDPSSLVARIFKEKYFKDTSILEASLGKFPSFIWRSVWSTLGVIRRGMRWRVGNGESISIWGQKWLPKTMTGCVQTPVNGINADARVRVLINEVGVGWKLDLVSQVFDEEEADLILSLPISPMGAEDRLIWDLTKDGKYTVRSAYHVQQQERRQRVGETSEAGRGEVIWKYIWKLGVPGSVKHFLWKLANNILLTKQNLYQRKIVKNAIGRGWKKPEGQLLKVNFDAAIKESTKKLGLGVIIRDCRGEVYAAACLTREASYGIFRAECIAMWEAMVLCEELGLGEVIFEGDAKSVIDAVSSGEKDDSSYGHLVENLQQKLNFYSRWEVAFIHREGNEVAHQLAKLALYGDNDMYWVEECPEAITDQLSIDKMYTDFVTS
ncbi:uncharacterized protein LOC121235507 [Juglans microcarpa x Juglans regia]|uniref:uncharacterized protein LOC121235507 n=1 Tax=Juglans microcarpa x Juglans regia TaxID=2249226 RepID=UPI001B7EA57B|nr:uncharacterized protein LOC121235507 [Juglans microcarpa x Juglans regia]